LRPHAKLAAGSDENIARRLHDVAARNGFIARSVSFKVEHEPTFEIASAWKSPLSGVKRTLVGRKEMLAYDAVDGSATGTRVLPR
jgi:hypothetical protein